LFIAESASILRASTSPWRKPDLERAQKYAIVFARYHAFLVRLSAPTYCAPLHASAERWLEALDLLSGGVAQALEQGQIAEVDALVRAASEAHIKLRTFQRTHAQTGEGIRKMFRQRPRAGPPRRRRQPGLRAEKRPLRPLRTAR
jgi:hypothetical protein